MGGDREAGEWIWGGWANGWIWVGEWKEMDGYR